MKKYLILASIMLLILTSCRQVDGPAVPGSTGNTYELIVACPDNVWNSAAGDTVRAFFGQYDTTLLMQEELYKLSHINEKALTSNKIFSFSKSILILNIDSSSKAQLETKEDLWAKPQRVFKLSAPDIKSFIELFGKYQYYMLEQYNEIEHRKLNSYFQTALNEDAVKTVGEKFGYTFNITKGFYIAKNLQDFMWLRSENDKMSLDFLIYSEDYISDNQLKTGYIVLKRNLITKANIPAEADSSYAKTSDIFPVTSKVVNLNGLYAVESRGAWDCYNDYMGGTFLNYTIVDTVRNKVLTIDGFVYSPSQEKRVMMMQLESMIYSIHAWQPKKIDK